MDDATLSIHIREQEGLSKYEFAMTIKAFGICTKILMGLISDKDLALRYPGLHYNIRFKDIYTGQIQLYEKVQPFFKHPDFFAAAGRSRDPRLYGPIYHSFFKMVHCDSKQTLRVLVAYY